MFATSLLFSLFIAPVQAETSNSESVQFYNDQLLKFYSDQEASKQAIKELNTIQEKVESYVEPISGNTNCSDIDTDKKYSCKENFNNKNVLYIGDSHSYLFSKNGDRMGNKVADKVNSCGASDFHYRSFCGARPKNWMPGNTPKTTCGHSLLSGSEFKTANSGKGVSLDILINNIGPDHIIINLGDNMFSWKSSGNKRKAYISSSTAVLNEVKGLLKQLSSKHTCTWIGPIYHSPGKSYIKPNSEVDKLYSLLIKGIDGRCTLIDGRSYFTKTSPNDGLHLINKESKIWGEKIADNL